VQARTVTAEPDARAAPDLVVLPDAPDPLAAYVPNLLVDWLADEPHRSHRALPGTFVFADISGFTALTERLAARGRAGAEEMGDLLNEVFDALLTAAYDRGASLLKWGGDAVLLLFDGPEHLQRGARAAWDMQQAMRAFGRLQTSAGTVRLGMSVGVHTGVLDVLLVGSRHRELVVAGPAATTTVLMEKHAGRGQVVLSPAAAEGLPFACRGRGVGSAGVLLARAPEAPDRPNRRPKRAGVDLGRAMAAHLRDHLRTGPVEHEHRGVAVGFVEVRGLDALPPADLVEVVDAVVDAAQEAAHAHQVTFLASDVGEEGVKLILTSGAPFAVGDAETRVLSAVRRVVDLDVPVLLRGGVTCGAVFAGDYGPFYRRTYSVAGDVVNLAARLMAKAGPGEVVATPEVLARSRSVFVTTPLEPFLVKGKRHPVRAVSVRGMVPAQDDHAEPLAWDRTAFVGRAPELAVLHGAADQARAGFGQVVEVVAPPGMGKSRLVQRLLDDVEGWVLRADGDIYGSATPYQPMQRMLRRALDLPLDVPQERLVETLRRLTELAAPDLLPYLPLVAVVAGVEVESTPEVDVLDPQVRRERLERVTSDLLGRLLRRPVVMVLNDTQFMDEATAQLVRRLAADAVRRPWLLVVTRRPDAPSVLEPAGHVRSLELPPLDRAALEQLVVLSLDGTPLAPHRRAELVRRAGGNPLFLRQLLSAVAAGADLDTLPDTVEAIIAVQVDRLPAEQRRWLRAASVLGMSVDRGLLRELLGSTGAEAIGRDGVPDLLERGADPGTLEFTHHLIRLTAYEGLPFRRRTQLHGRVADLLEQRGGADAALLSLHCLHGQRYPAAWRYSVRAGDAAARAYALPEARDCFGRALEAATRLPDLAGVELAAVCERMARVCIDLGEGEAAERALRLGRGRVRALPLPYARLALRTAWHRHGLGRHEQALRWVARGRRAVPAAAGQAERALLAELAEVGVYARYDRGAFAAARRWAAVAVREAEAGGDPEVLARCHGTLAALDALTGRPVDEDAVRATLALYDASGDVRGKATAANKLGMCLYFAGRWPEAVELYALAERCYLQSGMDGAACLVAANLAEVLVQQGRYGDAAGLVGPALGTWRAAHASSALSFGLMIAGRAALGLGDLDEGERLLSEARDLADELGEVVEVLVLDGLLAEAWLRKGMPLRALAHVEACCAQAPAGADAAAAVAALRRVQGTALARVGRGAEGQVLLCEVLAAARENGSPDELLPALDALLDLEAGTPEERESWARERAQLGARLGVQPRS
jgi:class 3 adenylate cyclase/tetratricopeptide (TPR) repeat protein